MILDATLAYLHFAAIFMLFSFLTTQLVLMRAPLAPAGVRLMGRVDMFYGLSSLLVLITGFVRLGYGAKGADFHLAAWPIYVKVGLFFLVGILSIKPTLAFMRWRRSLDHDPQWRLPEAEQRATRRIVMIEVHLAALIPVLAVMMSRGLGY